MDQAISDLLKNPAFWGFCGVFVTAYFGYKQYVKTTPAEKARKAVRKASSFEELRAVVEVLQEELKKKDHRYHEDIDFLVKQLRELRKENEQLRNLLLTHERRLNEDNVGKGR